MSRIFVAAATWALITRLLAYKGRQISLSIDRI